MFQYTIDLNSTLLKHSSSGGLIKFKTDNKFIKTSTLSKTIQPKFMYESYSEVIASNIGNWLGFPILGYSLCDLTILNSFEIPENTIACVSKDFTVIEDTKYEFTSIAQLMLEGLIPFAYPQSISSYNLIINSLDFIPTFKDYLNQQLLLDYIILNNDRHYGNFGILRNTDTNTYITTPIFDSGCSLFSDKHIDNMKYSRDLVRYLRCKPFTMNFDTQISLIDVQRYYKPKVDIISNTDKLLNKLV